LPSSKTAEGKARQRERNGVTSGAGSSGIIKRFLKNFTYIEWEDVEDNAEHVTDFVGVITHSQAGSSTASASLTATLEYSQQLLEAHLATRGNIAFIRVYVVNYEDMFGVPGEDDLDDSPGAMIVNGWDTLGD
jgi:hypothetical protein